MKLRRDVFQALADPTRRSILSLLTLQSLTAGAIASNFSTARPTISRHLHILTECELLTPIQQGREVYYKLNPIKMKQVDDYLRPFRMLWEERFDKLEALMKQKRKK